MDILLRELIDGAADRLISAGHPDMRAARHVTGMRNVRRYFMTTDQ